MKDLLLISLNRERQPYPVFPVGVWTLASYLHRQGLRVDVADMMMLGNFDTLEAQYLRGQRYRFVGLSIRNIDNLAWPESIDYLPDIREATQRILNHYPRERVMLGGAGYSLFGQVLLDHLGLTHGISGEGEQQLKQWLSASEGPAPDYAFIKDVPDDVVAHYWETSGMLGIQTRRGCPFACSYCTYPLIEGVPFRCRPEDEVVAELRTLRDQHGVDTIYFVDCLFNQPPAYTRRLLEAMIQARTGMRFYAFFTPKHFDEPLAQLLHEAGCAGVEFGAEAGTPSTLQDLGKDFGPEIIEKASRAAQSAGLKYCHYLMLGAPSETEDTVRETLDLIRATQPSTAIVSVGIRLYPDTPMTLALQQAGALGPNNTLLTPTFFEPKAISLKDILKLCKDHGAPSWIYPGKPEAAMESAMNMLRKRGARGPLWDWL